MLSLSLDYFRPSPSANGSDPIIFITAAAADERQTGTANARDSASV